MRAQSTPGEIDVITQDDSWPAHLHASVAAAGVDRKFTSLVALTTKAKRFDDRLVAALEMLIHHG